jgi:hypothetical protein
VGALRRRSTSVGPADEVGFTSGMGGSIAAAFAPARASERAWNGLRAGLIAAVLLSTAFLCSSARAGLLPGRIAYIDDHADALYTVAAGNPRATQLIWGTGFRHSPKWSPNGQTLAFEASGASLSDPWETIVLVDRAGHVIRHLLQGTHAQVGGLGWSPDGKRIAYMCGNGQSPEDWELCLIDVATGAHHTVTRPSTNPITTYPAAAVAAFVVSWSRDGTDAVFNGIHDAPCPVNPLPGEVCSQEDIYVANVITGATRQLTDDNSLEAQYSPDGHEIVFEHIHFFGTNTAPSGVDVMSASGAHARLFVPVEHFVRNPWPAWSPDGKKLVYSSAVDGANNGNTDLFTINVTGPLGRTRVTDTPDDNNEASWAPVITTCTVPKLKGKTLASAKTLIKRAGCKLGKVTGPKSKHVVGQKPTANRDVPTGTPVNVRLG